MGAIQAYKVKPGVTAIILLAVVEDGLSGANRRQGDQAAQFVRCGALRT